jgi:HSP20 family protein
MKKHLHHCQSDSRRGRHHFKRDHPGSGWKQPPVNVRETDDQYELFVYAAGYSKSDFELLVNDNTLVIRAEVAEDEMEVLHWRRYEFQPRKFERRFDLDERIDKEGIKAKYVDGILEVVLPKASGFETKRYDVDVE